MNRSKTVTTAVALLAIIGGGLGLWISLNNSPRPHAVPPVRDAVTTEQFYFLMADRFANGDTSNDTGGLGSDPMVSGFDPSDSGFFQGGDLRGILENLDYIEGLGTTAIWLTPSFTNKPVQSEDNSAGYHGYWVVDFTSIDPHLGTNEELRELVDAAHARGMKVYFDIITNHTADVIGYEGGDRLPYVSKDDFPYRDANGNEFDDRSVPADDFPALSATSSFPYVPVLEPHEANAKTPTWLNDITVYHNRGDTTFTGEDSLYGDFFGLDDLFTEDPRVVDGMIDIYQGWIRDYDIDGFRIDTMRHVDDAFWQRFGPEVLEFAHAQGKDEFFMFGEVFDASRPGTSHFTSVGNIQGVLDFPFQDAARTFASQAGSGSKLSEFFAADDWYTDADTSVYQLPTFLGNHDMGRIGGFILTDNPGISDAEAVSRSRLAHELMFFSRGNPVVYYGDEQGFAGEGGDKAARQTMFPTTIPEYLDQALLGTEASLGDDNFDLSHQLYQGIGAMSALASAHPALQDGAHISRASQGSVYAFSRVHRDEQHEYLVALNSGNSPRAITIPTWMPNGTFQGIYGSSENYTADAEGAVTITVPALTTLVLRAVDPLAASAAAPQIRITSATGASADASRIHVTAEVGADTYAEVSFWARTDGAWTHIGTDDSFPYQVFHNVSHLAVGASVEYLAVVADNSRNELQSEPVTATVPHPTVRLVQPEPGGVLGPDPAISAEVWPARPDTEVTIQRRVGGGEWITIGSDRTPPAFTVRDDLAGVVDGVDVLYRAVVQSGGATVTSTAISGKAGTGPQPDAVSLPGTVNILMGCAEDWQPDCAEAQLTLDEASELWSITVSLPAGSYEFKIAINNSWAENYGAQGFKDGPNIPLELSEPAEVTFTYDHSTHLVVVS